MRPTAPAGSPMSRAGPGARRLYGAGVSHDTTSATTPEQPAAATAGGGPLDTVTAGAPPAVVGPWLAEHLGDPAWSTCSLSPLGDGRSNLTFAVTSAAGSVVLRRPPLGSVAATAHDMGREQRVLTALEPTAVPVPRVLAAETDAGVVGAPFYVMELVAGVVPPGSATRPWATTPQQRWTAGTATVDVLADLHTVDPAAVGLAEFGRPSGFMARQVRRWETQWETWRTVFAAATGDGSGADRPELSRLGDRLTAAVPASGSVSVVHGDYRLENLLFDQDDPTRVRAVLDWEMSTLGDPLADLGLLLVYWHQAQESAPWSAAQYLPSASSAPGFPTRSQVVARYAQRRGLDPDQLAAQVQFYVGFGAFKLAVVLAGVVARASAGAADARTGRGLQGALDPLVALGHHVLDHGLD